MNHYRLHSIISFLFLMMAVASQTRAPWSLQECISYAHENNLSLKQQNLNAVYQQNQFKQKKNDLLPNLNGSASYRTQMGRVKDDTQYRIVDVTTRFSDFNISSSTPIFEGFTRRTAIDQGRTDWHAALKEVEKFKNDLALNITALYMQILFDRELLQAAERQLEIADLQLDRMRKLVDAGSYPEGNMLEMRSLKAREMLSVTQLQNNLKLSLLDLAQALDLQNTDGFDIQTPVIPEFSTEILQNVSDVYNHAVGTLPQIAISQYQLQSKELDVKIAKGYLMPKLSFNTGWGTSIPQFKGEPNFDFSQRFRDNAYTYYGLTLSVPIFNGFSVRTTIKNASIGVLNSQYELEKQKQFLFKEIQKAHGDAQAAYSQYIAGKTAVESFEESFRYIEKRYSIGMVNSVDYNVSKAEYMKSESDFIQAKYAYLLRLKILDFYIGKPLTL